MGSTHPPAPPPLEVGVCVRGLMDGGLLGAKINTPPPSGFRGQGLRRAVGGKFISLCRGAVGGGVRGVQLAKCTTCQYSACNCLYKLNDVHRCA